MKYPFKKQSYKLRKSLANSLQRMRECLLQEKDFVESLAGETQLPIDYKSLLDTIRCELKLEKLEENNPDIDILKRAAVIAVSLNAPNPENLFKWAISPWKNKEQEDKFFKIWGEVYGHPNHPSRCKDQYLTIAAYKSSKPYSDNITNN